MTIEELAQRLEAVTEDGVATWYAIHQTPEDIDDGDGSPIRRRQQRWHSARGLTTLC